MATRPMMTRALASISHRKHTPLPPPPITKNTARGDDEVCMFAPECWEKVKCRGMCGACYSSMRRLEKYGVKDLARYEHRVERFSARAKYLRARTGKPN